MIKRILSLLITVVLMLSLFVGCGASKTAMDRSSAASRGKAEAQNSNAGANYDMEDKAAEAPSASVETEQKETSEADALTGVGTSGGSLSNAILTQRKIIRNANVSIEVDSFDKAYLNLKSLIAGFGFIQESAIKKDKRYVGSKEVLVTSGVIIVRIDRDKFEEVLDGISGLGVLLDENIKSDDVTDKFFDTEARLRLLKFEESRLEDYLKQLTDLDKIFRTESRLTEIRYEIESLTGTLKKWNDLVQLSTITINMSEKDPVPPPEAVKEKTYWQRLQESFLGSFKGVISFCGEFILFLVQALPVLVLLALFVWIGLVIYRKVSARGTKGTVERKNNDSNLQ